MRAHLPGGESKGGHRDVSIELQEGLYALHVLEANLARESFRVLRRLDG